MEPPQQHLPREVDEKDDGVVLEDEGLNLNRI
jgi:hypothetical protein